MLSLTLEQSVYETEELHYSLVKAHVLSSFEKEVVLFAVVPVKSQLPWALLGL